MAEINYEKLADAIAARQGGGAGLKGWMGQIAQASATTILFTFMIWMYRDLTNKADSDQTYMRQSLERAQIAASEERVRLWEANSRQYKAIVDALTELKDWIKVACAKLGPNGGTP